MPSADRLNPPPPNRRLKVNLDFTLGDASVLIFTFHIGPRKRHRFIYLSKNY